MKNIIQVLERMGWIILKWGEACVVGVLKWWAEGRHRIDHCDGGWDVKDESELGRGITALQEEIGKQTYQTRWEEIQEGWSLITCTDKNPEWLRTEVLFNWVNFTHPTWMCAYVCACMHSHACRLTERRGDERKTLLAPILPDVCSVSLSPYQWPCSGLCGWWELFLSYQSKQSFKEGSHSWYAEDKYCILEFTLSLKHRSECHFICILLLFSTYTTSTASLYWSSAF